MAVRFCALEGYRSQPFHHSPHAPKRTSNSADCRRSTI
jgi:hypothetical protein